MAEVPDFQPKQYAFAAHIRDPDNNPPPDGVEDRRMAIYRELFFNNLHNLIGNTFPVIKKLHSRDHFRSMIIITGIMLYIFRSNALYRDVIFAERLNQAMLIVKSVTVGMVLLLAFTYMTKGEHFLERRSIVVTAWVIRFALAVSPLLKV